MVRHTFSCFHRLTLFHQVQTILNQHVLPVIARHFRFSGKAHGPQGDPYLVGIFEWK